MTASQTLLHTFCDSVTQSSGKYCSAGFGSGGFAGKCVSTQRPFLTATSSLSPSSKTRFSSQPLDLAVNSPRPQAQGEWRARPFLRMVCGSRLPMVSPGGGKSEDGAFYLTQAMGGGKIHGLIAFGLIRPCGLTLASPTHFVGGGEGLEDAGVYANSKGGSLDQGARCASRVPAPSGR